jgi:CubicO group peptidase (beta-lactamase class C family)
MLHKIRRHAGGSLFLPALGVVLALLALGLILLLPRGAAAQSAAPTPAWAARLDSLVTAEMERTKTPGAQVAVAYNGQVIYSRGFGVADIETGRAVTANTLFRVGSVTKMVTGAVLAQLAVSDKLDLRAPISRYVTELEGRKVGTVTTHQLLTHTAGWLDNAVAYGRMGEGALGEVMTVQTDTLFFTEPGRVLSYSNPGFSMAGYVAERAGGRRFGDLAEELVLRKVGMPYATFRPLSALTRDFSHGHIGAPGMAGQIVRPFTENTAQWSAGFLFASAQDMARFTIAVMDSGRINGQQAIPAAAIRLMTTPDPRIPGDSVARYAYGLSITVRNGEPMWTHGGSINGFDAQVVMFPARKLSIVVSDNRSGSPLNGIVDLVAQEVVGIARPAAPVVTAPRAPTQAERALLTGVYMMGPTRVELLERNDSLFLRQGPGEIPAMLVGDDRLRAQPPGAQPVTLILVRGANGRVEYLSQGMRALARQP